MDYNMIVRPLVGAVIGYSTNWLAIKMLFRPYEEKRIGNIKVPFTPGVIPRERDRIAKSLGGAVGQRLLTEEVITNELLNDKVIAHIKTFVIKDLLSEDLSLEDLLRVILKDDTDRVISGVGKTIVGEIGMALNSPVNKEAVKRSISDHIAATVPYNMLVGELINDHMAEEINGLIRGNIDGIADFLTSTAKKDAVKVRLAGAIETLVMEKVGALGAMFLDASSMADSVVVYIENLVREDEVQEGIVHALGNGVDHFREKNISETLSLSLYQEMVSAVTDQVLHGIYEQINEKVLMSMVAPMTASLIKKKIHLSDHEKMLIESQVEVLYRNFIKSNIKTFLGTFDVSKIVEGEINQFSVMDIESLIFAIVDKELNAITWIGGLLGFVIGLVYVVL